MKYHMVGAGHESYLVFTSRFPMSSDHTELFQVIVVGSGHAGSCAALSAIESGCKRGWSVNGHHILLILVSRHA